MCGLSLACSVTARQLSFRSRIASLGSPSSTCIPCPPVHYTIMSDIVMCGRCHKSGHRAPQCPEAPSGNASSRGARGPPPAPCWTCELIPGADALHWGDECPVAAERLKNRECTLCGSKHHRKKGCDKYVAEKHTAKKPQTTYFSTGPRRANRSWCLRCGTKDQHPTCDCSSISPPNIFPAGQDKEDLGDICEWCAIRGHNLRECMRRAPIQAEENRSGLSALTSRFDALEKSIGDLGGLSQKVDRLQSQMSDLLKQQSLHEHRLHDLETWRAEATSSISQAVSQSRFDSFVQSRFAETEQRAVQALPRSAFESFVSSRFDPVEKVASEAAPLATFEDYVVAMSAAGFSSESDSAMAPARVTGVARGATVLEDGDHRSPAERAKARAAKRAHMPSGSTAKEAVASPSSSSSSLLPSPAPRSKPPSTPGADAFAAAPPQHQWLHMSPDATSRWVPEALDLLFNEWSPHMDARLKQWASKHSTPEMRTTIDALVRSPMNAEKRKGLSSVLEGCRTPVRVFVNAAA